MKALALTAVLLIPHPALAHDWYPLECCHGQDCAPVDKAELVQGTALLYVTSKHGAAFVPNTLPRRESKDHRMHVCIQKNRVICIFIPPTN